VKRIVASLVVVCAAACGSPNNAPATGTAATPAASANGTKSTPPAEAKPQFKDVTIPAGTTLHVRLATTVASDASRVEDTVRGTLAEAIVVDETTVAPAGSEVIGTVLEAKQSGRVKGRAEVAIDFDRLRIGDETHRIKTAHIAREAASTKKKDAEKIGIGAGAGAVIGAIAGGKKGAAVGGAIGAGAGGGVVAATRGDEVRMAEGRTVSTRLEEPIAVRVPIK